MRGGSQVGSRRLENSEFPQMLYGIGPIGSTEKVLRRLVQRAMQETLRPVLHRGLFQRQKPTETKSTAKFRLDLSVILYFR